MNGPAVLLSVVCLWVVLTGGATNAREHPHTGLPPADPSPVDRPCTESGALPPTVRVDDAFDRHVRAMLTRSAAFRRQCRALATFSHVYVRVRLALAELPAGVYAQSQVQRTSAGPVLIFVSIAPVSNWSEWIGHEFEHVLEIAEGMRERDYRRGRTTWDTGTAAYESERAIAAGRAIRMQMKKRRAAADE